MPTHQKAPVWKHVWDELHVAGRFALVGSAATLTHMAVVWTLIVHAGFAPMPANGIAFISAFGISYAGNYLWTFRQPGNPRRALVRFLIVSLGAFGANAALFAVLLRASWAPPEQSALAAACVVPVISFIGSRWWSFAVTAKSTR